MHSRGGEKKRRAFLPPPFSSLRFQAAVQLRGSLLQATPAPTEPTGWSSSALQSQEPTAGSWQSHNNYSSAMLVEKKGKAKKKKSSGGASRTSHIDSGSYRSLSSFFTFSNQATFSHVSPILPLLTKLQRHSEDLIKAERS